MKLISGAKISGGMRMIDSKSSSLANVIAEDRKRKEEEKKARRMEDLNKQINTNLEKFQKQNQLGWGGKILKFLGLDYSQPLPNLANETPEYTKAREESESSYDINKTVRQTWYKELPKTLAKGAISAAKMSPLYTPATKEGYKEKSDLYTGAGKNIAQLATGTTKVALQAGLLPTQLGSKISEKLFGHSVDEVKKAEAFIDNNGILNYKPEYKNEAQKMGGNIAELASWFIPITRYSKVAEGERILSQALKDIPAVEKMLGKINIVKSGGKFFYEVGKDAVDVAVLDALRGKNWEEIKSDMPGVIVGGTFIRGGGKLIEANRLKKQSENAVESITKAIGDLTPEEVKIVKKGVEEGSPLDNITRDILSKKPELTTQIEPEIKIETPKIQKEKISVSPKIEKPELKPAETPKMEVPTKKTESPILKKVNTYLDEASKLDEELPTTSFRKEFANAENRINKDPQKAYNDAVYGTKEDDVTKSALQISLLENAKIKNDNKAIAEIGMAAAKHGRRSGQESVMFRALYDIDPMNKLLVDLANTKLHNIESRYPKFLRKILKKEEGDIVSTSSRAIKKKTPSIKDAQEIINSFICK